MWYYSLDLNGVNNNNSITPRQIEDKVSKFLGYRGKKKYDTMVLILDGNLEHVHVSRKSGLF